jgi:hypothetical protein
MDKHEKIIIYNCEFFLKKGPRKRFDYFWLLNHSLKWFLVVSPKDGLNHLLQVHAIFWLEITNLRLKPPPCIITYIMYPNVKQLLDFP